MSIENHCSSEVFKVLKTKQFHKIVDFLSEDVEDIAQATGISYKELANLRQVVLAKYAALPVSGDKLYHSALASTSLLSTGSKRLDELLDGGIYTGEVTEFAGEIASGKTQICFTASATLASQNSQNAIYIDTSAAFSAMRLLEIIQSNSPDKGREVLACVSVADAFTVQDVFAVLDEIRTQLEAQTDPFYRDLKLVVFDSVASVIYPILGTSSFAENQGVVCLLGQKLKSLAVEFSIAVVVTNRVVISDDGTRRASLGKAWSHVPNVRVLVGASEFTQHQGVRTAMLAKSPRAPLRGWSQFTITNKGVEDGAPDTTVQTGATDNTVQTGATDNTVQMEVPH